MFPAVKLAIPGSSLVLLIGPAGCGKSTFAKKHFKPTEVVSSDFCRALVSDDEGDQSASAAAFEVLHLIAAKRLSAGRLIVIDATNVQKRARGTLLSLARECRRPAVAIVFNLPVEVCIEQDRKRAHRRVGAKVIRKQAHDLQRSLPALEEEGFAHIYVVSSAAQAASATRTPPRGRARIGA